MLNLYYIIIKRTIELLLLSTFLSTVITVSCVLEIISDGGKACFFSIIIADIIFILANVKMLRICYFENGGDKFIYYTTNYISYLTFVAINLLFCYFNPNELYTYLFLIMKLGKYATVEVSSFNSALVFHAIMMIIIGIAPTGIRRVLKIDD